MTIYRFSNFFAGFLLTHETNDTIHSIIIVKFSLTVPKNRIGCLQDFIRLRAALKEFKDNRASEFDLAPLQKWMEHELGVVRLVTSKVSNKRGQGSKRFFNHPLLAKENGVGNFTIHVEHKKREVVNTWQFKKHVFPVLEHLIELIEQEAHREA